MVLVVMFVLPGAVLLLLWTWYAIVRIKHVRVKRVVAVLEWLAFNAPELGGSDFPPLAEQARLIIALWENAQSVFGYSFGDYVKLVWDAKARDLYWANRFGSELYRLSASLVPLQRYREERLALIAEHVRDFGLFAATILQLPYREASEA